MANERKNESTKAGPPATNGTSKPEKVEPKPKPAPIALKASFTVKAGENVPTSVRTKVGKDGSTKYFHVCPLCSSKIAGTTKALTPEKAEKLRAQVERTMALLAEFDSANEE